MKAILYSVVMAMFVSVPTVAQELVGSKTVTTEFSSKAAGPAQDIYAIDKTGAGSLDLKTGAVNFEIHTKNYSLPKSLMQKHYNERYMETDKYPLATFKGTISSGKIPTADGKENVSVTGTFNVHGVTKKRTFEGTIEKKGGHYLINAAFEVRLADHNIEIPVLFFTKITEAVQVKIKADLVH